MKRGAWLSVAVLVVGAFGAFGYAQRDTIRTWARQGRVVEADKDAFREMVRIQASIENGDTDLDIAKKITAHLYQTTLFTGKPFATTGNDALRYVRTVNHQVANMCATLTSTEIWELGLFGIRARPAGFASERYVAGKDIAATHTLVEVKVDGTPMVFDPTFSTMYTCEGSATPLNVSELRECAQADRLKPVYLSPSRPGRAVEDYPLTFHELSYAVDAHGDGFYPLELPKKGWLKDARGLY